MNYLLTALAPILWGTTYWVTSSLLPPGRPLLAAALRALPLGLVFVVSGRWVPRGIWIGRTLLLGLLNFGAFFALLFVAAYRLPGGVAATLGGVGPLAIAVLAWPLLGLRPGFQALAAGVVGVVGVGLLVLGPGAVLDPIGVLAALGSVVCMAFGSIWTKKWGRPEGASPAAYTGWQLAIGGLVLAVLAVALEGIPTVITGENLAGYAYLAVLGTGLAYLLWFRGLELLGVGISFLSLLSPLVATVLGWAVLGQALTPVQIFAGVLVLGSVVAGQWPTDSRRPQELQGRQAEQTS